MRIAYITPYQGPELRRRRPIVENLALAGNLKIELIAELLEQRHHQVEIFSAGEVGARRFKFYPAFDETPVSAHNVHARYSSALPVRFVSGFWSTWQLLRIIRARHREAPFDLVIIYNLQQPQAVSALYAVRRLRLSPHLLSRTPESIPKVLLRGVISPEIVAMRGDASLTRKNWAVFSGTHFRSKGLPQLIAAWKLLRPAGWELHIAGYGELTDQLQRDSDETSIVFHGLLNRQENARLLYQSRIGVNPHELSRTPGNVFAFKIIEYLAAGAHVITTPMGVLEPELEAGVTYVPDNRPETIAQALADVIARREFERTAADTVLGLYSPDAVATSLDGLIAQVRARGAQSTTADAGAHASPPDSGGHLHSNRS